MRTASVASQQACKLRPSIKKEPEKLPFCCRVCVGALVVEVEEAVGAPRPIVVTKESKPVMFRGPRSRKAPVVEPVYRRKTNFLRVTKSAFREPHPSNGDSKGTLGVPPRTKIHNLWLSSINRNVLLPALVSLRGVGVRILDNNDGWLLAACSTLWALISVGFQSVNICTTIMGVVSNNFHGYLLDQVSFVLATLCSVICSVLLAFSPRRLNELIERVEDTLFALHSPRDLRQYWMPVILLTLVGWLYMALRFVAVTWVLDNQPPKDVFKRVCLKGIVGERLASPRIPFMQTFRLMHEGRLYENKVPVANVPVGVETLSVFFTEANPKHSDRTLLFFVALIWYLNTLFVYGTLVFVPILFISFCLVLARAFKVHNVVIRNVHKSGLSLEADSLAQVRIFYERICTLVTDLNEIFGPVIFSWYIMIVLSVCIDMTQLFSDTNLLKNTKEDEGFLFSLRGIYSLLSFLGTCLAASRVSEEALAPLPHLHELTLRSWRLDMDTKMEAHFFLSRLSSSPVSMTGWNFFTINRSFILSVCAALTTYVVIIIQMNPKAMKTINKLVTTALNNTGNGTASSE
ncbi:invertebrate gustatory receptor, putative [Ixodes scapularis]|uniref:Invertebrate gustatory receptor, putative n=1 Tax=Ixodes scapularis TaxID=6945 RepID=B7QEE6_IXOSC|nr:invertebrate gustatory receptor, putative [Ixodes scapularis]|eukprot:XP_002413910.1 invertebrate gustatory receptor, putative [Ixodes scapularis]